MLVIRNTQKVSKELGLKPGEVLQTEEEGFLGSWFCNIMTVRRRKCLIFCHSVTLYCFVAPCVTKKSLSDFSKLFSDNLKSNLEYEGFSVELIKGLLKEYQTSVFLSKTNNRSVLGSMNDYAYLFSVYAEQLGPVDCDILDVNNRLNRVPMGALKYSSGITEMKRHLVEVFPGPGSTSANSKIIYVGKIVHDV